MLGENIFQRAYRKIQAWLVEQRKKGATVIQPTTIGPIDVHPVIRPLDTPATGFAPQGTTPQREQQIVQQIVDTREAQKRQDDAMRRMQTLALGPGVVLSPQVTTGAKDNTMLLVAGAVLLGILANK